MSTTTDPGPAQDLRRPRQGLIVRPDGIVEVSFLDLLCGKRIGGRFHGADWRACLERNAVLDNWPATSFARSLGWRGAGTLRGVTVFVGDGQNPDVPGTLLAAAVRNWDVILS